MIAPKVKIGLSVFMDEAGQVGFTSTSQNQITNLGMLELAKAIVLGSVKAEKKEESRIVVPEL
jgi:hypothetical protein